MSILVIITYYNRFESCKRLVEELLKTSDADIVVFDDCSDDGRALASSGRVTRIVAPTHRGKAGFWRTYNDIFAYSKEHKYDYYIILPDDVFPCEGFVDKAIAYFQSIPNCTCLSPLLTNQSILRGISRWGNQKVLVRDNYFVSHYFDCCGIVTRSFFEALNWRMLPIKPSGNKFSSSGVGMQITLRLQNAHKLMCHVKRTLLRTTDDVSEMNKEERARTPMRADFADNEHCVDIYMASLWRGGHVVKTVNSLLRQHELKTLTICCNNYTDEQFEYVGKELQDERVKLVRTNNEKGSNEKMRFMYEGTAKYIALADDDIIYPDSYLFKMIHGCNIHNGAVSLHGCVLKRLPIEKYYCSESRKVFSWNKNQDKDMSADILGNAFILFKREWFSADELKDMYVSAPDVSMDDIILSCAMQKKRIPRYVLKHGSAYASHKVIVLTDNYVYDRYKHNDKAQVIYINTHLTR